MTEKDEKCNFTAVYEIFKFKGDYETMQDAIMSEGEPYKTERFTHNVALNEGINHMWTQVCGGGGTDWSNSNAYVGVGDGTASAAAAQTGLQAASNKTWKAQDGGYPTYGSSQEAVWQGTFGASDANYSWEEFTIGNSNDDSGENLFRKVESKGTKSGGTWVLRITATGS